MAKQKDQVNIESNRIKMHEEMSILSVMLNSFTSLYFLCLFILILLTIKDFNLFILLLVCLISSSVLVTYIQFGKHSVSSDVHHIYIKKGCFKPTHYTIPIDKIHGLIIKNSFPKRLFNIVTVEVFYSIDNLNDDQTNKVKLFSFIKKNKLHTFLLETIPHIKIENNLRSIPKQAVFINLVQPSYSLIFVTFFIFFFWPEYWFIPIALFFSFVIYRLFKTTWTKYHQGAQWIQLQTGVFSTNMFIMKHENIDTINMSQSWLQQKFNLATVSIYTRSKPTHFSIVEHIPLQTAREIVEWYEDEANKYTTD